MATVSQPIPPPVKQDWLPASQVIHPLFNPVYNLPLYNVVAQIALW